jgi:hypothetical protein
MAGITAAPLRLMYTQARHLSQALFLCLLIVWQPGKIAFLSTQQATVALILCFPASTPVTSLLWRPT